MCFIIMHVLLPGLDCTFALARSAATRPITTTATESSSQPLTTIPAAALSTATIPKPPSLAATPKVLWPLLCRALGAVRCEGWEGAGEILCMPSL